jgi:hypothetical protein
MSATHNRDSTGLPRAALYVAFDSSWASWKLASTTGSAQSRRLRAIAARSSGAVMFEIAQAKHPFELADEAMAVTCYEAGREGFWVHRVLAHGDRPLNCVRNPAWRAAIIPPPRPAGASGGTRHNRGSHPRPALARHPL